MPYTLGELFDAIACVEPPPKRDRLRLAAVALLTAETWEPRAPTHGGRYGRGLELARLMGCAKRSAQRALSELDAFLSGKTYRAGAGVRGAWSAVALQRTAEAVRPLVPGW